MDHLGTVNLATDRLLMRRFCIGDVESGFNNWTSDNMTTKYLRWKTHENIAKTQAILENWIGNYSRKDYYQWAILLKENLRLGPIGTISVNKVDENIGMVHVGFCIGSMWWNRGIMSEALSKIIAFMFEKVHVNRIESWHDPKNIASGKVMIKCGMLYEGTLRAGDYNNTGIVDACEYAILRDDKIGCGVRN